ncbi:cobalt ABC transporter ATP-binding protein [Synergistales bacterium]|nr:cobalt ABC transporter ATP-binding protein [Synergistales bacterium]
MSIKIENLACAYNIGTPSVYAALRGVSVTIERGEWLSVVGHTGSGKSTLAQHLNALLIPQSGSVEIDGVSVTPKTKSLRNLRKKVGLVFQYPEMQFFSESVREEIEFAPLNWGAGKDELDDIVKDAAASVGLGEELLAANPFSLSGGQKRRVAVASVIAVKPDYLVLDEPTAGLDAAGIRELMALLGRIRASGVAVVQVTHDLQSALEHSDRLLVLEEGVSVSEGTIEETAEFLLKNPVRGLVIPPLVRFAAGLRDKGLNLPLTSEVGAIVKALEEYRGTLNNETV